MFALEVLTFTLVLWLGLYLFFRVTNNPATRLTGAGTLSYAFTIASGSLARLPGAPALAGRLEFALLAISACFWTLAVVQLGQSRNNRRSGYPQLLGRIFAGAAALLFVFLISDRAWESGASLNQAGVWLLGLWSLLPLAASLIVLKPTSRVPGIRRGMITALAAAAFFTIGILLFLFPPQWLPRQGVLLLIALDFELLGFATAWLDAFDLGEKLVPDFLRSLLVSFLLAALFGAQPAFGMAISTGITFTMAVLLYLTLTAALLVGNTFDSIQHAAEQAILRVTAGSKDDLNLRAAALARIRKNPARIPDPADEESLFRFTRRALSDYGNLPRLISNPLTQMAIIDRTLRQQHLEDSPLERARILKIQLAEAVMRLKPDSETSFGETDEWRFFNALYYPYVLGLKPYSLRIDLSALAPEERSAIEWFRRQVPERTLHNWQNAAARLIMQDLKTLL